MPQLAPEHWDAPEADAELLEPPEQAETRGMLTSTDSIPLEMAVCMPLSP
jgi:hypothetical protein